MKLLGVQLQVVLLLRHEGAHMCRDGDAVGDHAKNA